MDSWFTVEQIDQDTFVISEYKHWEETHCYLLCGTKISYTFASGKKQYYVQSMRFSLGF